MTDEEKRKRFHFRPEEVVQLSAHWQANEARMLHEGVAKDTLERYRTNAKRFVEFAKTIPEGMTEEGFVRFIWGLWQAGAEGGTIEMHRCGMLHFQRAFRQPEFCGSQRLVRLCAALKLYSRKNTLQRGGIVEYNSSRFAAST